MWKLVIEDDEARRTVVPLSRDAYDVGRSEENAIRLTERNISRRHARFERKTSTDADATYRIEDLASLTGVYVNGVRLEESVEIAHGDLIVIGDYRISVENESLGPLAHESTNPELKVTRRDHQESEPFRLLIVSGPDAGKVFPLTSARTILGRAEDATIQLAHPSVSRQHAEVAVLHDGRLELIDSGSSNGLILNGKTIRREILEGGDLFELGDVRVRVLEPGAAVPTTAVAEVSNDGERPRAWLPAVVFVAVVVIGGAAAWLARQPHALPSGGTVGAAPSDVGEPAPASATDSSEQPSAETVPVEPAPAEVDPLAEAIALCKHQECDRAREVVDAKVPADDPRLSSADAKAFFHDWAVDVIARAKVESDVELKRRLLERVRLEILASPADRDRAKRALDALPAAKTEPIDKPAAAAKPASADREKAHKPAVAAPTVRAEDPDKIRAWMMGSDVEKKQARDYLYGRLQRGQATRDELKGLQGLCKDLGDAKCVDEVKAARNQEPFR
jgi:pSer/pThr/pTyr-binding forkhead associated (FHA) protein